MAPSLNPTSDAVEVNKDRHQILLTALCTSDFFIFNRKFVTQLKLGRMPALFLQDLINHYAMEKTVRTEDGAFLCTVEYLKKSLGWSRPTQGRLLNKLTLKGLIKVYHEETTGHRWISIDVERILTGITPIKRESSVRPLPRLKVSLPQAQSEPLSNTDIRKTEERSRVRSANSGAPPKSQSSSPRPQVPPDKTVQPLPIQKHPTTTITPIPKDCPSLPYNKNIPSDEVLARELRDTAKKLKVPFSGRLSNITDKVGILRRAVGDDKLLRKVFDFYLANVTKLTGGGNRLPQIVSLGYISVSVFRWWKEEMEKRTTARAVEKDVMFGYDFDNNLPEHLIH